MKYKVKGSLTAKTAGTPQMVFTSWMVCPFDRHGNALGNMKPLFNEEGVAVASWESNRNVWVHQIRFYLNGEEMFHFEPNTEVREGDTFTVDALKVEEIIQAITRQGTERHS